MQNKIIHVTSGEGPEECERVVYRIVERMKKECNEMGFEIELIDAVAGKYPETFLSVSFYIHGSEINSFIEKWEGTILWIAQSPFRKFHKRKNWFAGVSAFNPPEEFLLNEKDISFQTMRASGPGGQNVNKVETAVRATHVPSNISAVSHSERSQTMNKKEALSRLKNKLIQAWIEKRNAQTLQLRSRDKSLERGNAKLIFRFPLE